MRMTWSIVLCALVLSCGCAQTRVQPGIDVLIEQEFAPLDGKRVGLVTNPTGVTADLRSTIDVLYHAPNVQLVALFGPEHGVRGDAYAGDKVADARDPKTGLPVYSLYGPNRKPSNDMLDGIDVLVFDIQDIGARSYTFISTMAAVMEAAAANNVAVVVLDRPNPLGGHRIEGRPLDLKYKSFVGYLPVTYLHGMTVGELAKMINGEGWLPDGAHCDLTVVPMRGWRRRMLFEDTGLQWAPTSPHLPRADTSLFYAATGIMGELQVWSEGVGYTLPFELVGAQNVDADRLADELNSRRLPGVVFRPQYFKPYYAKHKGKTCGGVQIHLTDKRRVALTPLQFHVMDAAKKLYPDTLFFNGQRNAMFDKVCGTNEIRRLFESGAPLQEILAAWNEGVDSFAEKRRPYLIYSD